MCVCGFCFHGFCTSATSHNGCGGWLLDKDKQELGQNGESLNKNIFSNMANKTSYFTISFIFLGKTALVILYRHQPLYGSSTTTERIGGGLNL